MTTIKFEYAGTCYEARSGKNIDYELTDEKGLPGTEHFNVYSVRRDLNGTWGELHLGYFYLSPFPGCCAVVVSHNAFLFKQFRGSGHSDPFRLIKAYVAKKLGYSMMVATTITSDIPAFKSFLKAKYRVDATWTNPRTKNSLALGHKQI